MIWCSNLEDKVTSKDFRQHQLKCPECDSGDKLRKIEDFYRRTGCSNEWFPDELIIKPYKTASFINESGKTIFIAQTPERLKEMKERGVYDKGYIGPFSGQKKRMSSAGISKKDKNLLRRLKK